MTIPEIFHQLERVPERADFAPYATALEAAIEQREAITPELIASLERVTADPGCYLEDSERCPQLFAIYLLAQFRETRARDAIVRFLALPDETTLELTGDMVTENGAVILASVCGGDPAPLLQLSLDESVNEFVRAQAIEALAVQLLWGERAREAVIADLRRVFQQLAKPGNEFLWGSLLCLVCDLHAVELLEECQQILAGEFADPTIIGPEEFEEEMAHPSASAQDHFRDTHAPIDTIAECSTWDCFQAQDSDPLFDEPPFDDFAPPGPGFLPQFAGLPNEPFEPGVAIATGENPYLAPPKIGRNDPCPCGSGKKHKKCCGKN